MIPYLLLDLFGIFVVIGLPLIFISEPGSKAKREEGRK